MGDMMGDCDSFSSEGGGYHDGADQHSMWMAYVRVFKDLVFFKKNMPSLEGLNLPALYQKWRELGFAAPGAQGGRPLEVVARISKEQACLDRSPIGDYDSDVAFT